MHACTGSRRRGGHVWLAMALMVFLAGCAGSPPDPSGSSSALNWRQFQGTTLRILLGKSPWQAAMMGYFPEFEERTGIRLVVETYTQDQLWNTLETDLHQVGRVDVFAVIPNLDGIYYLSRGYVQPINLFLKDPRLTAADYQWEDFLPRFRAAMEIKGDILGPPVMTEHLALLYRKDLFKQYQITVPRTLDELEMAAKLLHRKPMGHQGAPGVGIVSRGNGAATTALYASLLYCLGGTWMDGHGQPTMDGPQSLAALGWINRLLGQYAPPNVSTFGWQEASELFLDGRAAMYIEGSSIYPLIEESSKSRVSEQVGYAPFPAGPAAAGGTVAVRGLTIARRSLHPEAAWLFLQWATGREMVRKALMHGVLVARESTWQDRVARSEVPPELAESLQQAGKAGVTDWLPPMIAVTSAREAVGKAVSSAVRGEDIPAAADAAAKQLREILVRTEGGKPTPSR
jgi:multiple sugar transport system substrate-binding protein